MESKLSASPDESEAQLKQLTFKELGLSEGIVHTLSHIGFKHPTPIQEQAIPILLEGKDLFGIAQTGTGKTAAFLLPILEMMRRTRGRARMPRALILEPTRELAAQVSKAWEQFCGNHKIPSVLLIGGTAMEPQERALSRGVDLVIATPGRLLDMMERGRLMIHDVQFLIIDEGDRMLDMGFIPDIEKILSKLPEKRQTALFSATVPPAIAKIAKTFMKHPQEVAISTPSSAAQTVTQWKVPFQFPSEHGKRMPAAKVGYAKRQALRELLKNHVDPDKQTIIFCNRKRDVDHLGKSLEAHGFKALTLHGDMQQNKRMKTLQAFRDKSSPILVASDVAARGLDVNDIGQVISFDVPMIPEEYVHRIGRTGRAGKTGSSYLFSTADDEKQVKSIERMLSKKLQTFSQSGLELAGPIDWAAVHAKSKMKPAASEHPTKSESSIGERRPRPMRKERKEIRTSQDTSAGSKPSRPIRDRLHSAPGARRTPNHGGGFGSDKPKFFDTPTARTKRPIRRASPGGK